jgi:hypothetical protein|tara:strand:+ start:187 stop:387 length:201 start_codon:yes stop_codon:yes gene_type:complete
MYQYTLFMSILCTQLFSQLKYDVGDQISNERQDMEFDYCYPSDSTGTFSFSEHAGKIFVLEMSASW